MVINRKEQIARLKNETFDLLIIGGGATGAGIAFDAALRGYRTALIDAGDFAGQTSSKSTKLLHGGVRYLEKAFKELDFSQFHLVKSGLEERSVILTIASHLSRSLPLLIPVFSWFQAAYYWAGIKVYDFLARGHTIGKSRFISQKEVCRYFPKLSVKHLKGAVLYFDGQFDDARLNVSLAISAVHHGAAAANYVKAVDFEYLEGRIEKVHVEDQIEGKTWAVKAKAFVNATGPFTDAVRRMDSPSLPKAVVGSIGTHLVLNKAFAPKEVGLLIPKTSDGRVLFLLPWENHTLVGTTDLPVDIHANSVPSEQEVNYLLGHLKKYLGLEVSESDVLAKWAGIRPLVSQGASKQTAKISRDFMIEKSPSGLYSIMGGKWTSYRKMGEELLDSLIKEGRLLKKKDCQTQFSPVIGGEVPWEGMRESLHPFAKDIQDHLYHAYGTRSVDLIRMAEEQGLEARLHPSHPYIEAEVVWSVMEEMALKPEDFLERRVRLMMLDQHAADQVYSRVADLMGSFHHFVSRETGCGGLTK